MKCTPLGLFITIGLTAVIVSQTEALELKGLQFWLNILTNDWLAIKLRDDEEPISVDGVSRYSFVDYVSYKDYRECGLNEKDEIFNAANRGDKKKPIIKVKCAANAGNGTVQIINSVKEVVTLLAPLGNSTKKTVVGNCALILFYTQSCMGSAMVAPHFNALAKQFPDIKVAAIDAFRFTSFNTEFGIVGLPTVLLFHQGRPIVKFNDTAATVNNFVKFVTKHTGIESVYPSIFVTSEDFNGPLSNKVKREEDVVLFMAWLFIAFCAGYYFTKSIIYFEIIEMIKRNWRESEAQLENS